MLVFIASMLTMAYIVIRKKREAKNERIRREMTEKMNMDNMDFFANISHEFSKRLRGDVLTRV